MLCGGISYAVRIGVGRKTLLPRDYGMHIFHNMRFFSELVSLCTLYRKSMQYRFIRESINYGWSPRSPYQLPLNFNFVHRSTYVDLPSFPLRKLTNQAVSSWLSIVDPKRQTYSYASTNLPINQVFGHYDPSVRFVEQTKTSHQYIKSHASKIHISQGNNPSQLDGHYSVHRQRP